MCVLGCWLHEHMNNHEWHCRFHNNNNNNNNNSEHISRTVNLLCTYEYVTLVHFLFTVLVQWEYIEKQIFRFTPRICSSLCAGDFFFYRFARFYTEKN